MTENADLKIAGLIWDDMNKQIAAIKADIASIHTTTEQAGFSDGVPAYTFVNLPANGLANGTSYVTIAFCSNGRKSGEGVGAGTGVPVYWNAPSAQWLKFSDDTAVTI